MKVCPACKRKLPETEFYRKKNGLQHICKECKKRQNSVYREQNRDKVRALDREYYRRHREAKIKRVKIGQQRRRQTAASLLADFTDEQWQSALEAFGNRCAYCGGEYKLSRDHVVPVSAGGAYTKSNIVPACIYCNSSKGSKNMRAWYKSQPFYSPKRLAAIERYLEESEAHFGSV